MGLSTVRRSFCRNGINDDEMDEMDEAEDEELDSENEEITNYDLATFRVLNDNEEAEAIVEDLNAEKRTIEIDIADILEGQK